MNVRQLLERSATLRGLGRDIRRILNIPTRLRRNGVIKDYLASTETSKLQLGAGPTSLDGWLSTDIAPASDQVMYLDATNPFPFENDVFDYIYSEHMIEHISWHQGAFMLRECLRVLKPGGTIRIATPDLAVLIGLYGQDKTEMGEAYIRWITDRFLSGIGVYKATFVINNAFRNWGHQFLYDADLMAMALQEAGFTDIKQCPTGESDHAQLSGIESHGKNVADTEMAVFETMVFEATRPG